MKAIARSGSICLTVWLLCVTVAHAAQPPRYDVKLLHRGGFTDVAAGGKVSGTFFNEYGTPHTGIWSPTSGFREVPSIRALSDSGVYVTGGLTAPSSVWGADGRLLHQMPSIGVVVGDVNSAGAVVGTTSKDVTNIWTATGATTLQAPPNAFALARAINESGQAGGMLDVKGGSFDGRAAVWSPDGSYTLLEQAYDSSEVLALNNVGEAVGIDYIASSPTAAYWKQGKLTNLGNGWAFDLNDGGTVVGAETFESRPSEAKIWIDLQPYYLNDLLTTSLGEGWRLTNATGVSSDGWIIGEAGRFRQNGAGDWVQDRSASFLLAPVPEPTTWALMLGGLAAFAVRARRSRQ